MACGHFEGYYRVPYSKEFFYRVDRGGGGGEYLGQTHHGRDRRG